MGRVKGTLIKNVGKKVLQRKELFSESFEKNKQVLKSLGFQATKAETNKVAGFIARKLKTEKRMEAQETTLLPQQASPAPAGETA